MAAQRIARALFLVFVPALYAADLSPFARDMLAAHNAVRKRVGVPQLVWSDRLAAAARRWADTLIERNRFEHNPRTKYGENLFEQTGAPSSPSQIVAHWASEQRNYNYAANSCRGVCGHYTQIVWRNTKEVGCAMARRGKREVTVCEYDPPGNFEGQRPY
jgi:uncharacterized protein YkwD